MRLNGILPVSWTVFSAKIRRPIHHNTFIVKRSVTRVVGVTGNFVKVLFLTMLDVFPENFDKQVTVWPCMFMHSTWKKPHNYSNKHKVGNTVRSYLFQVKFKATNLERGESHEWSLLGEGTPQTQGWRADHCLQHGQHLKNSLFHPSEWISSESLWMLSPPAWCQKWNLCQNLDLVSLTWTWRKGHLS